MNLLAPLLAQAETSPVELSAAGALIMTASVAFVLALNIFCLTRILREPRPAEHIHTPLDVNTQDRDT